MDIQFSVSGLSQFKARFAKWQGKIEDTRKPMMRAAIQVIEETFRNFADGGRPEKWAPLSLMTLFIRAHRADAPRRSGANVPLSDTGRLKGSFVPFVGTGDDTFGAKTNVKYAGLMQNGGTTEAQDIPIKGYTRRLSERQFKDFFTGRPRMIRKADGGMRQSGGKVRDYVLHLKGGAAIPARPFFPRNKVELDSWGYSDKIRAVFDTYFNSSEGAA